MNAANDTSAVSELRRLRTQLEMQISETKAKLQAVDMTLAMLAGKPPISKVTIMPDLRGLKQKEAIRAIAEANDGIVRTREAKDQMVYAGLIKGKRTYNTVYKLLAKDDDYEKYGEGVYRLKSYRTEPPEEISLA